MITCKTTLTDEKREALIEIALNSQKNIHKRKIITPVCAVLAVLEASIGLYFCADGAYSSGISLLTFGFIMLLLAFRAKAFQRFVLRKAQQKFDVSFNEKTVEYIFNDEGIMIKSHVGNGINYWNAFKEYGAFEEYIFVKRKDNEIILIDKNDLTGNEADELLSLLSNNIQC